MNQDFKEAKRFGVILSIILFVIGVVIPLFKKSPIHSWLVYLGGLIFVVSFFFTKAFIPIFKFWMKFTQFIGKIVSALILSAFFYLVITPIGLVMKCFGRDPLARKWKRGEDTYWIKRDAALNDPKRLENQY